MTLIIRFKLSTCVSLNEKFPIHSQSVKVKTELTLPPLHVNDDPDLNLRELFVYRAARGFEKLTAKQIDYISKFGYADF